MSTILIVEDSPFHIDLLVSALEDEHSLHVAIDTGKAFRILETVIPDLIILDAILPGMNGYEFLDIISSREEYRRIPVIFASGMDQAHDQIKGLNSGAVDYITKPFHTEIVKRRISLHLELSTHRKHLEKLVKERTEEIEHTRDSVIQAVAYLAESRDKTTGEHIFKTQRYIGTIADHIAASHPGFLPPEEVHLISQASALHDIGKMSIPDSILSKPGPLTQEEMEIMKRHTVSGATAIRTTMEMIGNNDLLEKAYEICLSHHEKHDGSGYPSGLRGDQIPPSAAVLAIVDVYDALVSERPYKKAYTHEQAVQIITAGDGRTMPHHFHPIVLEAFLEVKEEFRHIHREFSER